MNDLIDGAIVTLAVAGPFGLAMLAGVGFDAVSSSWALAWTLALAGGIAAGSAYATIKSRHARRDVNDR